MRHRSAVRALALLAFSCVLTALARDLAAQRPVAPGDRVRLYVLEDTGRADGASRTRRWSGRVAGFDRSAVILTDPAGGPLRLPRDRIASVQVWAGTGRRTWWGVGVGALVGAALGGIAGRHVAADLTCSDTDCSADKNVGFLVGLTGAVPGALIGGAVGWFVKRDRWRDSRLPEVPGGP